MSAFRTLVAGVVAAPVAASIAACCKVLQPGCSLVAGRLGKVVAGLQRTYKVRNLQPARQAPLRPRQICRLGRMRASHQPPTAMRAGGMAVSRDMHLARVPGDLRLIGVEQAPKNRSYDACIGGSSSSKCPKRDLRAAPAALRGFGRTRCRHQCRSRLPATFLGREMSHQSKRTDEMPTDTQIGADIFMTARSVRQLRADGVLPASGSDLKANRKAYILAMREAAAGRVKAPEATTLDVQRARLTEAQAEDVERKNAFARRELLPAGPVNAAVIGMIEVAKAKLKRVGGKVGQGDARLAARINAAINDALSDLSDTGADEVLGRLHR